MSKRISGQPRHPRSPVAKAVRTPAFKMRVVPDKRWLSKVKEAERNGSTADAPEGKAHADEPDRD